jgi:hypothetical protein
VSDSVGKRCSTGSAYEKFDGPGACYNVSTTIKIGTAADTRAEANSTLTVVVTFLGCKKNAPPLDSCTMTAAIADRLHSCNAGTFIIPYAFNSATQNHELPVREYKRSRTQELISMNENLTQLTTCIPIHLICDSVRVAIVYAYE